MRYKSSIQYLIENNNDNILNTNKTTKKEGSLICEKSVLVPVCLLCSAAWLQILK